MSDPLLVPMHLEAMVLNKEAEVAEGFNLATPVYSNLKTFDPIGPTPFPNQSDTLDAGIYLAPSAFEAGFVSAAHSPADIEATIAAARGAFAGLE